MNTIQFITFENNACVTYVNKSTQTIQYAVYSSLFLPLMFIKFDDLPQFELVCNWFKPNNAGVLHKHKKKTVPVFYSVVLYVSTTD